LLKQAIDGIPFEVYEEWWSVKSYELYL
jgi:hypothetical protein